LISFLSRLIDGGLLFGGAIDRGMSIRLNF
jgi:hypothetical protein